MFYPIRATQTADILFVQCRTELKERQLLEIVCWYLNMKSRNRLIIENINRQLNENNGFKFMGGVLGQTHRPQYSTGSNLIDYERVKDKFDL